MAYSGSYQDHKLLQFSEDLNHELQQKGTLLLNTVQQEQCDGLKKHFTKLGKMSSYEKTVRGAMKNPQDATFERRVVTFTPIEADIIVDKTDLHNMVSNPQSDYAMAIRNELGRKIDEIIMNAIEGSATVETNGSESTVALPSASQVAVNNHDFDSGSGDVALTPGKLKKALALLGAEYVDVTREQVFVVGPMNQLMKLSTSSEVTSADFRNKKPLNIPGVVPGIDGYLGLTYIAYEGTGTDSNSDELVYMFPKSAIKVGIREQLHVTVNVDYTRQFNPNMVSGMIDLGAVRMYEEKVIQIACDPNTI